ncbi:unnamed protein product [Oreochromis niloticus]|nr:unnamed protein product [Mustela putorius furo]
MTSKEDTDQQKTSNNMMIKEDPDQQETSDNNMNIKEDPDQQETCDNNMMMIKKDRDQQTSDSNMNIKEDPDQQNTSDNNMMIKEDPDQQVCNQERNSSLEQENPEPTQIKDEQEELCISQEGEQLVVKEEEVDGIIVWTGKERLSLLDKIWKPKENLGIRAICGQSRGRCLVHRNGHGAGGDASRSRSPHRPVAWRTEADPDDAVPQPPRFRPKRIPGVQPPLNAAQSPGEIFSKFFDDEVLKCLCENTNKNAAKKKENGKTFAWKEITPEELQKYLGLLLYMAVCNFPKMVDIWRRNTIFHVPFPATVMSKDRFMAINSILHISDPEEDVANGKKKGTEDYDTFHPVRPLLEMMRSRCMSNYHPKQHISVEERMVANPTKWGLKFFVLADVNGYIIDFKPYTGKSTLSSGKGVSFDVVTSLVDKDYLGSGYIVYCDNFYTSPALFQHLKKQGFGACGTYREGRLGVPSSQENALHKRSPRGSIRWIRDGDLLFVKWLDSREVSICTTVHPVYSGDTVLRWQKNEDGHFESVSVPRPTAVTEYNKYVGGVDTSDQMLGTNSVLCKTKRSNMTVFRHLLDIAVTNCFILHKELCISKQQKHKTRQTFQEELAAHLLGVCLDGRPEFPSQGHFPVPTSTRDMGRRHRASLGRKQCTVCKRSTPWKCQQCSVGLCLQLERNCFLEFHQRPKMSGFA